MNRRAALKGMAGSAAAFGLAQPAASQAIQTPAPRHDKVSNLARALRRARWEPKRAFDYMARFREVKGCNFVLSDGSSIWAENNRLLERELGYAHHVSLNSVRVWLPAIAYQDRGDKLFDSVDRFLDLCAKNAISVMPVLSVETIRDPAYRPRPEDAQPQAPRPFRPGVHGGGGGPRRPGLLRSRENMQVSRPITAGFVAKVLKRHAADQRIIGWDLYNEPWLEDRPMVEHVFEAAREVNPSQPLSACWQGEDLSDVYNFHTYGKPGKSTGSEPDLLPFDVELKLAIESGRPLLCTECLARTFGNTFESFLPYFSTYSVGWYIWGLCAGSAQHHFPWAWPIGSPEPKDWFHCILYPDGTPYREREIELIRTFRYTSPDDFRSRPQFKDIGR